MFTHGPQEQGRSRRTSMHPRRPHPSTSLVRWLKVAVAGAHSSTLMLIDGPSCPMGVAPYGADATKERLSARHVSAGAVPHVDKADMVKPLKPLKPTTPNAEDVG